MFVDNDDKDDEDEDGIISPMIVKEVFFALALSFARADAHAPVRLL